MLLAIVCLSFSLGFVLSYAASAVRNNVPVGWRPQHQYRRFYHAESKEVDLDQRTRSSAPSVAPPGFDDIPNSPTLSSSQPRPRPRRIVVAMTGATGAILGIEILKTLGRLGIETHLILSHWALETIRYETKYTPSQIRRLATRSYNVSDASAPPSSGSFPTDGMIIVPCSMKTLSAIRHGYGADLVARSADVNIKEQRKLVVCVRETPLSSIHLENMLGLSRLPGVVIFPPVPAFYTKPESLHDIIQQTVGRMIDALGFDSGGFKRWGEDDKHGHDESSLDGPDHGTDVGSENDEIAE